MVTYSCDLRAHLPGCCLRIRPETLDLTQHPSGLRPSAPPTGKDSSEG